MGIVEGARPCAPTAHGHKVRLRFNNTHIIKSNLNGRVIEGAGKEADAAYGQVVVGNGAEQGAVGVEHEGALVSEDADGVGFGESGLDGG